MGRDPKYDPDGKVVKDVLAALRMGNTKKAACAWAGISTTTLDRWIQRYPDFAREVQLSEARVIVSAAARLTQASAEDPKWSAYMLRIKDPENWREVQRLDVRELDKLPMDTLIKLYAKVIELRHSQLGSGDPELGIGLETEGIESEDVEDAIFNES